MFELEKTFHFEAGHVLTHHDGHCSRPHGHSYVLKIKILTNELITSGPKTNMVFDFGDLTKIVKPMIDQYFDHHWLNDTLNNESPTAEFIARWIYHYLKNKIPFLHSITLWETASSSVTYRE